MAGSHRLAIAEYLRAYAHVPKEPLVNLCLGLAYLHLANNRKTSDRQHVVMQSFSFLYQYFKLRNKNMEATYNIARAFHQLGLVHLAVPYYERVLAMEDDPDMKQTGESLKRETAFNLSLIYKASGSYSLARQVLHQYIVI
jgi:general transcription factor 3C polypeptide 3 (transcription factor C subunit 4)